MPRSINSLTIDSLKLPFSFAGEFAVLEKEKLISIFSAQKSYKTKFFTLLIIEGGSGVLQIDSQLFDLQNHRVFYVNYNQVFRFSDVKNFRGTAVLFTKSFYNLIYTGNTKIKNDSAFLNLPNFIDFSARDFIHFKVGIAEIRTEFFIPRTLSQEIICLLLKATMLKYGRNSENSSYIDFKTHRINSYIESFKSLVELHFKDLKRTSNYAQKLTISANYLNALVKDKLDISAENYIQDRVILEAERLLLNTNLTVTEISFDLGFTDKSHFGKYFKRITQESPNQFRKKFRG